MKRIIILFLSLAFFFVPEFVFAWPSLPDIKVNIPNITLPTATPTPIPTIPFHKIDPGILKITIIPTTSPTTEPTLTPTTEPSIAPTKEKEIITITTSPTSPIQMKNLMPTVVQRKATVETKDFIYGGIISALVLALSIQIFQKIKKPSQKTE